MIKTTNSRELYVRLLEYVRPYWRGFAVAILCMGISAAVEPVFPFIMKNLLDNGFSVQQDSLDWMYYPLAIIAIFLVRAVLGFCGDYAMSWVSHSVIADMRKIMFAKVLRLPASYYSDHHSGRLMSKITYDVTGIAGAASSAITSIVKDSLSVLGLLCWLLYLNWALTLIALVMIPFIALSVRAFSKRMRRIAHGLQDSQGTIQEVLQEAIEGHKVVKVFGGHNYEENRFFEASKKQRNLNLRSTVAAATLGPIVQFFATTALAIIMAIALKQAANEQTTIGGFVSFITAMLMLLAPLKRLTDVNSTIQRGLAAAESVFALMDQPQEEDVGSIELGRAQGMVEFKVVSFKYPEADRPTLSSISLTLHPGECVALVGQSGSGKTTIANLLPRFIDASSGTILIDGHPIRDIRLNSLRENIAFVGQDVVLFNDTIAANIAYGSRGPVQREEIIAAAQAANALEFITQLPGGFDTLIGENGIKLSGGQRQRLAIARAIFKNAPILILDEATSALDTESERQVQKALETLMKGRTTLVIAHRLSTIEKADKIFVIQHGRIAEFGNHSELINKDGIYAQLHKMNFSEQVGEDS